MHWVSPFGDRRVLRFISAYRRFSQISTSFIASDCLGIHRVRLLRLTSQPEGVSDQDYLNSLLRLVKLFFKTIIIVTYLIKAFLNRFLFCKFH